MNNTRRRGSSNCGGAVAVFVGCLTLPEVAGLVFPITHGGGNGGRGNLRGVAARDSEISSELARPGPGSMDIIFHHEPTARQDATKMFRKSDDDDGDDDGAGGGGDDEGSKKWLKEVESSLNVPEELLGLQGGYDVFGSLENWMSQTGLNRHAHLHSDEPNME